MRHAGLRRRHTEREVANVFDLSFTTNHLDVVIRKRVRVCVRARSVCVCERDFGP